MQYLILPLFLTAKSVDGVLLLAPATALLVRFIRGGGGLNLALDEDVGDGVGVGVGILLGSTTGGGGGGIFAKLPGSTSGNLL